MLFLELLVDGCFLNLGEKCGFVIIKSEKNSNSFSCRTKNRTILHITVNGEERNLDYSVLQTLAQNSANSFHPHPPRYIHTFLLFLFILTTCCFYESGHENCGFGTSAVSRNYVQIQNFKFWDWHRVGFNTLFKLDCLTCYVNDFFFFLIRFSVGYFLLLFGLKNVI